ncbi:unnamed protein product [Linum trigynum]|uniref:Uncharacterized protein n=1 Tax=Linum trigynum TaxID=586398 RepID=A0AAV2GSZ0_9ROSI
MAGGDFALAEQGAGGDDVSASLFHRRGSRLLAARGLVVGEEMAKQQGRESGREMAESGGVTLVLRWGRLEWEEERTIVSSPFRAGQAAVRVRVSSPCREKRREGDVD